ncbi:hypothetical protein J437_LFUL010137 [Ladona fulva]|uniref:Uncharacterized protein n=1 Tax=Ladona fulva TaxID=123851 RepID=A0A8K0KJ00_LADFU|nr:hypothetical protein J437_LFUL010137 [Ladona fulva]
MAATTAELYSIPKEAFSECFQQWWHHWQTCVESQGYYFEGASAHRCIIYGSIASPMGNLGENFSPPKYIPKL